jgi:hypothetical protein
MIDLAAIPIGIVYPRDPRVMARAAGAFMARTTDGWRVGPLAAFADLLNAEDESDTYDDLWGDGEFDA